MQQSKIDKISKKITLLNQTTLDSMVEKDDKVIIKNFILNGIKILEADFGWAWWKDGNGFKLAYKSPNVPFEPPMPRPRGGNYVALETKKPFFDTEVRNKNYKSLDIHHINHYMKSYVIIPIYHGDHIYGNLMFCNKKPHNFTKNELVFAQAIGSTAAQAITIHRLVAQEKEAAAMKERQKATDILLAQEKLKNEFIANTTHEFRTPLTIMRGQIYLANKKNNLKAAKTALKEIDEEIINLSELLSDLVLLTAEKVQRNIDFIEINVAKIVAQAANKLEPYARENGVTLIHKCKNHCVPVIGNNKYLERGFLNLIRNAITYGGKTIEVECETKKGTVSVHIKDDGIGISKKDLPHIFERFFRADRSHNREGGHSGLGLPITKWVVEMHKGKISVKSAPGKGSTFTVTLPIAKKS